ncbi:hypothetical protein AB0B79_01880 [Streptomyces sp. NPDC039022]|uniref:hypothetical protein n=1 Tax=Streptomyces sp. NPDC039022 TaxID=3157091 RepID=UPI0033FCE1FC
MDWLYALVSNHMARTEPSPCLCHGRAYVYRGLGTARTGGHQVSAPGRIPRRLASAIVAC